MICLECGARLPDTATSCSACGRRFAPERIEPVLARGSPGETARAAARTWRDVEAPRPEAPSFEARWSQAIAAWPHARHAVVAIGCVLAIAIYFSAAHDQRVAAKAGAARIAAATGAVATTSQPAQPGPTPRFSAKHALQGLYGNYDPVLDGAYWTVTGAPKRWADWNGRTVLIRPLVSRSDEGGTRHVLVTHSVEMRNGMIVKQGAGCRSCKSLVGGVLFERRGDEWALVSDQRFLGVEGAFGAPPQVSVAFPARTGVELRIEPSSLASAADAPAPAVVLTAGKKAQGVLAPPRPRPTQAAQEASPFPTSVSGP